MEMNILDFKSVAPANQSSLSKISSIQLQN